MPKKGSSFRFTNCKSSKLVQVYARYDGDWNQILDDADYELLGCTKTQAIQHLKYLRTKKGKKRSAVVDGMFEFILYDFLLLFLTNLWLGEKHRGEIIAKLKESPNEAPEFSDDEDLNLSETEDSEEYLSDREILIHQVDKKRMAQAIPSSTIKPMRELKSDITEAQERRRNAIREKKQEKRDMVCVLFYFYYFYETNIHLSISGGCSSPTSFKQPKSPRDEHENGHDVHDNDGQVGEQWRKSRKKTYGRFGKQISRYNRYTWTPR